MDPVELRSERLVLSTPVAADVDAITAACQDPDVLYWTTLPSNYQRADAEAFVANSAEAWEAGTKAMWMIRHEGVVVGSIGLHAIASHFTGGTAEIGYWMAREHRGQGLLTEAARAVMDWGFAELHLVRIDWHAAAGNIASARAARSLGFHFEGFARQSLTSPRGRYDGWSAGILASDDRTPVPWSVLDEAEAKA